MYFNRSHRRSGHLFQGRFQAIVVDTERWGLELSRHVHLNPVRVKRYQLDKTTRRHHRRGTGPATPVGALTNRLAQLRSYRWSSYRAYIGWEARPGWLVCDTILSRLGGPKRQQPGLYQQYVERGLREGLLSSP
jgi:putative transposase